MTFSPLHVWFPPFTHQVHWPSFISDPKAIFDELNRQQAKGRIRSYGVSNFGPQNLKDAQTAGAKLSTNQVRRYKEAIITSPLIRPHQCHDVSARSGGHKMSVQWKLENNWKIQEKSSKILENPNFLGILLEQGPYPFLLFVWEFSRFHIF